MSSAVMKFLSKLTRKKKLDTDILDTPLNRCLNLFDLVLFGVGHMVGAGIFVITGTVLKNVAGPGIVISYTLAAIAAVLSALCYAEFGARVPKAGSSYTYTYVTIGEFVAFIVGWSMILENIIGAASVARAWSGSFDSLFAGKIKNGTLEHVGSMDVPWFSHYPDFIALLSVLIVVVFVCAGAKVSTTFNSILTVINITILSLIIGLGFYLSDTSNWSNFLPNGFSGVIAGAGSCFYAYIGFEGIAIAGEEAKNPERTIPLATGLAVAIASVLYVGCAATLSLMVPYYSVDVAAPFPNAFSQHGLSWAKYVIAIGALVGISTSLLGSLFSLPRSVYAMASDGLLFRPFSYVNSKTQTPILSIVFFGILAGILALLVDLEVLVELLSIGTLLGFTIVAACVVVLHYEPVDKCQFKLKPDPSTMSLNDDATSMDDSSVADSTSLGGAVGSGPAGDRRNLMPASQSHDDIGKLKKKLLSLPLLARIPPGYVGVLAVCGLTVFMVAFWLLVLKANDYLGQKVWWSILLLVLFCIGLIVFFLLLIAHEQNKSFLTFQVPCAPLLPVVSMMLNIGMMLQLNVYTWIRLIIWLIFGFLIYFAYGIWHSTENDPLLCYSNVVSYSSSNLTNPTEISTASGTQPNPSGDKKESENRSEH